MSLWSRTRNAVYGEITRTAMELFLTRGFDATTIDDIAAAGDLVAGLDDADLAGLDVFHERDVLLVGAEHAAERDALLRREHAGGRREGPGRRLLAPAQLREGRQHQLDVGPRHAEQHCVSGVELGERLRAHGR